LQQFVGISFKRDNNEETIVNLFTWDNGEVKELEKLTAASESRNTLENQLDLLLFLNLLSLSDLSKMAHKAILEYLVRFILPVPVSSSRGTVVS
jgi:type I site-specific restriction-modification system R (restriction) subunit